MEEMHSSREWIELAARAIELFGVAVIVIGVAQAGVYFILGLRRRAKTGATGTSLAHVMKLRVGRNLLLGLEILVAADIIETVALELTLESVAALGLLVLVRTFLSWTTLLEIEERWPWQKTSPAEEPAKDPLELPAAVMPRES
jgi:uncharacterized membrane protein